jgi:tRNA-Thr(GGU) m(6)t(6)A37 methyltransferase TsaA
MTFEPIGFVRSPYKEKRDAPRQGVVSGAEGTIELSAKSGFLHALEDLEGFERIIVIFHFHEVTGWRPKVQPPRSSVRRGVFATRSPHRPNAIGFSVVKLLRVEGLVLHIAELDMLDGTPVLDIKPYVPYADAFPNARAGWLDHEASRLRSDVNEARVQGDAPRDPIEPWGGRVAPPPIRARQWLAAHGSDLRPQLEQSLALGPAPHAYRRIRKKTDDESEIALKDFRATFVVRDRTITVRSVYTAWSPRELATMDTPEIRLARAFTARAENPDPRSRR